jgi:uncharacterized membrane protein YfcA
MYAAPTDAVFLIAIGVGTGIVGAILGTGGGVFLIPLLVLAFGVPMHFAIGTSILSVIATSTAVACVNVERGTANMRLGMTLEIGTSLGAISGGLTAGWLPASALEILFAVALLPTAILMWRGREDAGSDATLTSDQSKSEQGTGWLGGRYHDPQLLREVVYRVQRLWAGFIVSFFAGVMSGLLGIGGGVFKVPALNLLCKVPIKAAAATSNFMIGVTAAASAFLYFGRGEVRPILTAAVVFGVLVGSAVGSYVNRFVGGRAVTRTFAVVLVAIAMQMFVRVVRS